MKCIQAICLTCAHKHDIHFDRPVAKQCCDWVAKHAGHKIHFEYPERSNKLNHRPDPWMNLISNANVNVAYAADAAFTITLASLGTSSGLLAGREATAISNTSNLYLDYLISGKITVGTTPTVNTNIEIDTFTAYEDTPTWPTAVTTGFTGSDAPATIASAGIKASITRTLASILVDATTSNREYDFIQCSLASLYGGICPNNWDLFVTHSTVAALNATPGNHAIYYKGVYLTVA